MRNTYYILVGLVLGLAFIITATQTPLSAQMMQSIDVLQSTQPDSIVQLTAETQGLTRIAPADLPRFGTFWVVTSNGLSAPFPCMPNGTNLPVFSIADNSFLVDQSSGQISINTRLSRMQTAENAFISALDTLAGAVSDLINRLQTLGFGRQMRTMGLNGPSLGDGSTNGIGSDYNNNYFSYSIDTNQLWLEITNVANGISYYNLHNATNQIYEILTKTNLLDISWAIEQALWPTSTNCQPFTLANNERQILFVRALDWTGVTHGGNGTPDWWLWQYFGTTSLSDTNLDSQGQPLLYDYTNHLDPNIIFFSLTASDYLNTDNAAVRVNITAGSPSYCAVSVNGWATNWQSYLSSNLSVYLGSTNGTYTVTVGLKGIAPTATETWQTVNIIRDATPLVLTLTNLSAFSGSKPFIDPAGYASKPLRSLFYTVIDANGVTNTGSGQALACGISLSDPTHVTNQVSFVDLALALGTNKITLQATDWAGNVATTNFNYIYDTTGDVTPPTMSLYWPQNATVVCGNTFTVQATLSDDTAAAVLHFTDTNGITQTVNGLVERGGNLWFQNVPLPSGTNSFTIKATSAAGNVTTTNITVIQSPMQLTITPLSSGVLNQSVATVSGCINDPSVGVVVNGVAAVNSGGYWTATAVPLSSGGTVTLVAIAASGEQVMLEQERPPVVFTKRYSYNNVFGPTSDHVSINWEQGGGGTNLWTEDWTDPSSGDIYHSEDKTVWPADSGYVPVLGGQHTYKIYKNGEELIYHTQIYDVGAPDVEWMEQATASGSLLPVSSFQLNSRREVRLATGGKAIRQSQALFDLSAAYTYLDAVSFFYPNFLDFEAFNFLGPDNPPKAVPAASIKLGALGYLGNDGHLWTVLPNSAEQNITPQAAESFIGNMPGQQKHTPYISANDAPLDPVAINVTNCVGQKIVFKLAFDPVLPSGVLITNQNQWWLPSKYVNAQESFQPAAGSMSNTANGAYFLTICHPAQTFYSRAAYAIDSPYCTFYKQLSWPLTEPETGAWWVTGGPKAVSCYPKLTLANDQKVSLGAVRGNLLILKPQVTSVVPGMYAPAGTIITNETPYKLSLGKSSMIYDVYISQTYPGSFGLTQLTQYFTESGYIPPLFYWIESTGDDFWLDSSHEYYSGLKNVILNSGSWPSTNSYPASAKIEDAPQGNIYLSYGKYYGQWKDYVRFTPSGRDSIPITLGRVDWSWNAEASLGLSGWVITSNSVAGPTLDRNDDSFPTWTRDKSSPTGE